MKSFTQATREQKMKSRNQLGINMIGLIIWMFLAVAIMGGVTALFSSTSQQTALGAEQNQQQQSILNALNRVSRDVSISNPIIYASPTEIVMDVNKEDGSSVDRRRYLLNMSTKEVWEYSKPISRGATYDPSSADAYWNTPDVNRKAKTVYGVDVNVAQNTTPFLQYFDSSGKPITGTITASKDAEAIARVDISLTAAVANKGNVSLSTSAVPRATTNLGATATPILAPCPAFTATLTGNTVVLRWDKASDDTTSYEITRNGVTIQPTTAVTDKSQLKYNYTDNPGVSSTVLNYMLKVVSPAGISNCIDSVRPIVITPGATQLTATLVPATTVDGSGNPVSTAWSNSGETTKVNLSWQKVDIATGYVIYRQKLDSSGAPVGAKITETTLDAYPYVDLNSSTQAAAQLSYTASAGWDEYWEWSIKILSRSGENTQTPEVRSLSYPHPLSGDSSNPDTKISTMAMPVKAGDPNKVSDADIAAGFGNTKISWTYTAGMEPRGFDVYRSAIDKPTANFPAGFTKIGSTDVGVNEFYDRKAELGSTYGYYVIAKNKSGFSNSYATQRVQQLQFPPDPVIAPVGANGSRDISDGTNRLMWSAAKSASGYHVQRANINASQIVCLSGADCTKNSGGLAASATQFDDSRSDVTPATKYTYVAFSYNATGMGPQLALQKTLTQRPSAPSLSKTASPTLGSLTTSMTWNATAGTWCVSGSYTGTDSNNCAYEEKQYSNNGSLRANGTSYATSYNWQNQDWGRHYTYKVRAQNAAIYNGGWSDLSGQNVAADTYPAPFNVNIWNGDGSGAQAQRINYDSSTSSGGWGNVRQAGYTTFAWGDAVGAGHIDISRAHDQWQVTSGDGSLLLPPWDTPGGSLTGDNASNKVSSGTWSLIAAPGTTYRYDATATSFENSLTRSVSTGNISTPADVPQAGAVQVVCSGPGNGDSTGTQPDPSQLIAGRTQYTNLNSRYGYFEKTAIEKLWSPYDGSGVRSNGWQNVPYGSNGDNLDSSGGVGYFRYIENGFNFLNQANGRTDSAVLRNFDNYAIYTFSGCAPSGATMQEPYDACYVSAYAGCTALNPNDRPKWLSR